MLFRLQFLTCILPLVSWQSGVFCLAAQSTPPSAPEGPKGANTASINRDGTGSAKEEQLRLRPGLGTAIENSGQDGNSSRKSDLQPELPPAPKLEVSPEPDTRKAKDSEKKEQAETEKTKSDSNSDNWENFLEASRKLYEEGKLTESANQLDMALAAAERLKVDLLKANVFLKLGEQYINLKKFDRAKILIEEGLALKKKIPNFKSVANANALDNLAQACLRTGDAESASKYEGEALSTYESLHKTETADYAIALANHANTLRLLKQDKEAEQFFAKAVTVQQKVDKGGDGDSIELAKMLLNAASLYCDMNKMPSAKHLLDRAVKIVQAKLSPEHPLYKLSVKGQRVYYKKLLESLLKKDPDPVRPDVAKAVLRLASLYREEQDFAQAAAAYKQAVNIEEKLLPADSPELSKIRQEYEACLQKLSN